MKEEKNQSSEKSNIMNKLVIKQNKSLFIGAFSMLVYSIFELIDCFFVLLIISNIIPNFYLYLDYSFLEIKLLLQSNLIYFLPMFFGFTLMRWLSTIGLFKNKLWGYQIGVISLLITLGYTILFLPIGFFEFLACVIILSLLIIGKNREISLI